MVLNCGNVSHFSYSAGDIALLNCTAIVNTSNESLNDKNPVSESIHQLAGPELRDELLKLKGNVRVLNMVLKQMYDRRVVDLWIFHVSFEQYQRFSQFFSGLLRTAEAFFIRIEITLTRQSSSCF